MSGLVLAAQIWNAKGILVVCRRWKKRFGVEENIHPKSIVSHGRALMIPLQNQRKDFTEEMENVWERRKPREAIGWF